MDSDNKRFDEWNKVDCEDCSYWWDNSCDGVPQGSQRLCTTFLATRRVVMFEKLKRLEKLFRWLLGGYIGLSVILILHMVFQVMGWV